MAAKYFAILTHLGAAKLANATALGTQLEITHMAVGDGGGRLPIPDPTQTALNGERRRAAINLLTIDPLNNNQIITEQVIPEHDGGWWIREVGLFDNDGSLVAIANCPETYKPQLQEGSGRTQTIRVILIVSSTQSVSLKIDPSVVLATRKYVDDSVIEVKSYTDKQLAAHLSASHPHKQYALASEIVEPVPLPDVWIPFNDSLKMITGFGDYDRVYIGDQYLELNSRSASFERATAATYIDKSGNRRTAAINEPRFEKQGLLIEGQSTNFFPWSQQFIGKWGRVDASLSPDATFPNAVALDNSIDGFIHTNAGTLEVGSTYTITAIVKGGGAQSEIKSRFSNFSGALIKKEYVDAYTLLSWSIFIPSSAGINHDVTGINWSAGKVDGVTLCALQIEKLPFASSYIPTNGSAVTRAADKCWISTDNNVPQPSNDMTICTEFTREGNIASGNYARILQFSSRSFIFYTRDSIYISLGGDSQIRVPGAVKDTEIVVARLAGDTMSGALDGDIVSGSRGPITTYNSDKLFIGYTGSWEHLFGHIRNLRIWHHTLSDAQIKGLA